jgi:hypothetical protein
MRQALSKIILIFAIPGSVAPRAFADPEKPSLYSCMASILHPSRAAQKERKKVLELLASRTLHESPARYLTLVNREGKTWHAKAVGYIDSEGKTLAKVMLEDGYATAVDLETVSSLRISDESRTLWTDRKSEFLRNLNQRTLHTGDAQYLTVNGPETEGVFMVRAIGYETVGKETLPLVMHTEGYIRILDPDEFENAFSSIESKNRWLGIPGEGGVVHVRKQVSELPLKRQDLIERSGLDGMKPEVVSTNAKQIFLGKDPIDPKAPADFAGILLQDGTGSERITKLAKSLDEKMDVKAIYSKEANSANGSIGFSLKNATLTDESGNTIFKDREIINMSDQVTRGTIGGTEIHEIGHARTNKNIREGKPDPLAIQYKALPGQKLPGGADYGINGDRDFYHQFSSADESRQHAFNFHNAVHQRVTSEVIRDFAKNAKMETHRVFGVNLQNFHASMESAKFTLDNLAIFNLRHTELALRAQHKLLLGFNERSIRGKGFEFTLDQERGMAEMIITTDRSKVTIPIVGNAFETLIKPVIRQDADGRFLQFSRDIAVIPKIKTYVHSYLGNQVEMLDLQFKAIEKSKGYLETLSARPFEPMSLKTYLKIQNTFTQVKTSVNYSAKKVESLLWVDPQIRAPRTD